MGGKEDYDRGVSYTVADSRYEPYIRPVDPGVGRVAEAWKWRRWDVHLEHVGCPEAPVRMLLVHGAGGNAAAMWPFAAHLSQLGALVTLVDLPGYGRTRPRGRGRISYKDWQRLLADLAERIDDNRPLLLLGASMGGMLALDTAAVSGRGDRVIVTCLLDVTDLEVRSAIVHAPWMARASSPILRLIKGPLRQVPLPLRWVAPMRKISNDQELSAQVLRDPRGGGGSMPLGWFRSFLEAGPAVPPEAYGGPPVLLVHPGYDRWTPTRISAQYLSRLAGSHRLVELAGCGHFPIEEPGFQQFLDVVAMEIESVTRT